MTPRKYFFSGKNRSGAVFCLLLPFLPQIAMSYTLLFRNEMNCSQYCTCYHNALVNTMRQYNTKHSEIMGTRYRDDVSHFSTKSEYMTFLGMFAPILHRITEITCELSDGMSHSVMSLLNGIDEVVDTALNVKCKKGENLIWDVPSWHTSFNIFVSENCNIVPMDPQKDIIIPMNLWILDVEHAGQNLFGVLDIRFTMNTLTLAILGSRTSAIPKQWCDTFMVSASVISLRNDSIEHFDCPFRLTKQLDTLNLEGNRLAEFPVCLLSSYNIRVKYLSLGRNKISDLTTLYDVADGSGVPDIGIINLSFNNIKRIEAIRDMGKLLILDLSHNAIKDITEDAFEQLSSLEVITLSHNDLRVIDRRLFVKNSRLKVIDLRYNYLTVVSPEQLPASWISLMLDVRNNRLRYPPYMDCAKYKLVLKNRKLDIYSGNNPFFCDCSMIAFENCQKWVESNASNQSEKESIFVDGKSMVCAAPDETKDRIVNEISFLAKCTMIKDCPATCSCTLLNTAVLVVNCSSRRLLEMPDSLPSYPNVSTVLYLDHNPLQMLNHRPYLRILSELHFDNCLLTSITPTAMTSLQDIRVLTLHNNLLQKLPASTRNITLNHARNVTLHNNRWACTCDSLWMPRWITKHKSSLWMPGSIVCYYLRKPIEQLSDMDLNCNSSSYIDTFLAISLTLSSLVSSLVIVICYRSEITVLLYSKLGFRLDCGFSYGDFFSTYDAFISYTQDSFNWVTDVLVPHMESEPRKYRLCLFFRDLPTGDGMADNLPWSVRLSRCAILVISKEIVKKEWSIMEVRAAFQRLLLVANKLLIIAIDDVNTDELAPDMRTYMSTHDYLQADDPYFWDKLEIFLPPPKPRSKVSEAVTASGETGGGDHLMLNSPEKNEETGISDLSDLSFKHTETTDLDI